MLSGGQCWNQLHGCGGCDGGQEERRVECHVNVSIVHPDLMDHARAIWLAHAFRSYPIDKVYRQAKLYGLCEAEGSMIYQKQVNIVPATLYKGQLVHINFMCRGLAMESVSACYQVDRSLTAI